MSWFLDSSWVFFVIYFLRNEIEVHTTHSRKERFAILRKFLKSLSVLPAPSPVFKAIEQEARLH